MRARSVATALTLLATLPALGAARGGPPAGLEALDWAFRFASAIRSDEKDRAAAQAAVAGEVAELGALDEALRLAERIEGWRRGTVEADVAVLLARAGRGDEARALLERAEGLRDTVGGWQGPRVAAHIAGGHAALGDVEGAQAIATTLAQNDDLLTGQAAATVADALAGAGRFDEGLATLAELDAGVDYDLVWWRTAGYVGLARQPLATADQRRRALEAAGRSAAGIPGWKQAEALQSIAGEWGAIGELARARELLAAAEAIVAPLSPTAVPIAPALLSNLARSWARVGRLEHARDVLSRAEAALSGALAIDVPALQANLAESHEAVGQPAAARRLYTQALESAAALENARPRALGVVAVCRSLGRAGKALDATTRTRLEQLYLGLGEPW